MTTDLIKTLEGLEKKVCWNNMERQFYRCSLPKIISALKDAERYKKALETENEYFKDENNGKDCERIITALATADTKDSEL